MHERTTVCFEQQAGASQESGVGVSLNKNVSWLNMQRDISPLPRTDGSQTHSKAGQATQSQWL
jgi:hypothetical protein